MSSTQGIVSPADSDSFCRVPIVGGDGFSLVGNGDKVSEAILYQAVFGIFEVADPCVDGGVEGVVSDSSGGLISEIAPHSHIAMNDCRVLPRHVKAMRPGKAGLVVRVLENQCSRGMVLAALGFNDRVDSFEDVLAVTGFSCHEPGFYQGLCNPAFCPGRKDFFTGKVFEVASPGKNVLTHIDNLVISSGIAGESPIVIQDVDAEVFQVIGVPSVVLVEGNSYPEAFPRIRFEDAESPESFLAGAAPSVDVEWEPVDHIDVILFLYGKTPEVIGAESLLPSFPLELFEWKAETGLGCMGDEFSHGAVARSSGHVALFEVSPAPEGAKVVFVFPRVVLSSYQSPPVFRASDRTSVESQSIASLPGSEVCDGNHGAPFHRLGNTLPGGSFGVGHGGIIEEKNEPPTFALSISKVTL